jgi:hypothetical protein
VVLRALEAGEGKWPLCGVQVVNKRIRKVSFWRASASWAGDPGSASADQGILDTLGFRPSGWGPLGPIDGPLWYLRHNAGDGGLTHPFRPPPAWDVFCVVLFIWPRDLVSEEMGGGGAPCSPPGQTGWPWVLRQWGQGGARCWPSTGKEQFENKHKPNL